MKILSLVFILLFSASVFGQKTFELKDASKYFDIKVKVATCDESSCTGKATFSFFKKGGTAAYQVINLPDTYVQLEDDGTPLVNQTLLYDAAECY